MSSKYILVKLGLTTAKGIPSYVFIQAGCRGQFNLADNIKCSRFIKSMDLV